MFENGVNDTLVMYLVIFNLNDVFLDSKSQATVTDSKAERWKWTRVSQSGDTVRCNITFLPHMWQRKNKQKKTVLFDKWTAWTLENWTEIHVVCWLCQWTDLSFLKKGFNTLCLAANYITSSSPNPISINEMRKTKQWKFWRFSPGCDLYPFHRTCTEQQFWLHLFVQCISAAENHFLSIKTSQRVILFSSTVLFRNYSWPRLSLHAQSQTLTLGFSFFLLCFFCLEDILLWNFLKKFLS